MITYIEDSPEEPGVKCLRIEESLSPAILNIYDGSGRGIQEENANVEECFYKEEESSLDKSWGKANLNAPRFGGAGTEGRRMPFSNTVSDDY